MKYDQQFNTGHFEHPVVDVGFWQLPEDVPEFERLLQVDTELGP